MGVEFYAVKRGRKAEEIYHSGYGGYHAVRGYLLSCFNTTLACGFFKVGCFRTSQEEEMLHDIRPYVPDSACPLFCSSDCDGEWSNAEVKGIVAAVKESEGFKNPDKVKNEIADIQQRAKRLNFNAQDYYLCGFQHVPSWKDKATEFINNLERVGNLGCRVFWC